MTAYFLAFFFPALIAFMRPNPVVWRHASIWTFIGILYTLFIGMRHQVGGDWGNYLPLFQSMEFRTYSQILTGGDPGYMLLNLLMYKWGLGIYGVNTVSAALFMAGLIKFIRKEELPWLAFVVAISYLLTVVSMGYVRQAVAIGLVMWAIVMLKERKIFWFLFFIAFAATFHKSAVLMVGVGLFTQGTSLYLRVLAIFFVGIGMYDAFLAEHEEGMWKTYVEEQMQSQGALIRVIMNFVPAILFFLFRQQWKKLYSDYIFWLVISLGAVGALLLVGLATTAVDRMSLYLIPLQIVVFARLPFLIEHIFQKSTTILLVISYYLLVLVIWLNMASNAYAWVPYNNILWLDIM